ncbi:DUF1697 domain-containing protein [Rhizosphaericola mali]|uniref:DUF1697 domain-containing protein n=1 Tax=Rhizosphaericola mali TaxID=2545455 RepID=A0A5P2G8C4_9BACT|nr:DUF1697 domain-containing protein [Rhizosphaericola mali]QES89473.1 DUF1697 domain-containing protein [Rhizosphaericola mali]
MSTVSTFVAFLRGVNVNGTSMKMAEVSSVFEKAGMQNVISILASGNIIFQTQLTASAARSILENAMSIHFNYEAFLFVKTKDEAASIFDNNPFQPDPDFHIYSFIGDIGLDKILMDQFENMTHSVGESAQIVTNNFYWKVPKGNTLQPGFGKILGNKKFKNLFTSRNINTFEKILKKM